MKLEKQQKEREHIEPPNQISFDKLLDTISDNNPDKLLEIVINHLKNNHCISKEMILTKLSKQADKESILVPVNIFAAILSPAEALVKYLKEEFELGYNEIASLINRDERGLWGTYKRSTTKMKHRFEIKEAKFFIPVYFFKERKYSILENVAKYLAENYSLSANQMSKLLNKKPGTLWSVINRVKNKK